MSGVLVHGVDLTVHRRAAAAVRESEERFRAAFDQAVVGLVLADPAGRVLRVNDAFCRIVGQEAAGLRGHDSTGYAHPDDRGPRCRPRRAGLQMRMANPVEPAELVAAVASLVNRL